MTTNYRSYCIEKLLELMNHIKYNTWYDYTTIYNTCGTITITAQ
jgi:hypothetical protein